MALSKGIVTTSSITFGTAITGAKIAQISIGKSTSSEAVEVSSMDDTRKRFVKGALIEDGEFSVTIYDDGTFSTEAGTTGSVTITSTLSDGTTAGTATRTTTINNAILTAVKFPDIDATGDRKATIELTFKPDGTTGI